MKLNQLVIKAQDLQETLEAGQVSFKDIAIIGIAGRWPLAEGTGDFWSNIRDGKDCIGELPVGRKADAEAYLRSLGRREPAEFFDCGYLSDIDRFDHDFFDISHDDACLMDPQQRLLLQTAHGAIEDAGYGGAKIQGSKTGVFVGMSNLGGTSYIEMISKTHPELMGRAVAGNLPALMSSRISYTFDLHGPSLIVDTTCSSALVSLSLACKALRDKDCDMAIAGSVRAYLLPLKDRLKMGMESSSGRTRTFDNGSDGTGQGEGVVAVLLKPLRDAIRDRDNIHAVVKGSAVNHDGKSIGYKLFLRYAQKDDGVIKQDVRAGGITIPSAEAQALVIEKAWQDARVDPETIQYVEVHGTGTKVGDPVEIDGLTRAFSTHTQNKQFCAIGTVKTNVGHLYDSSGLASLAKVVQMLKHRQIPPSIHFDVPNRKIDFINSPVYFNDILRPWESNGHPRRCGISIFGFSGTNCHVVVEEPPPQPRVEPRPEYPGLLTLSGRSVEDLHSVVAQYIRFLETNPCFDLESLCFTANTGRGTYKARVALVFTGWNELVSRLEELARALVSSPKEPQKHRSYYLNSEVREFVPFDLAGKEFLSQKEVNLVIQELLDNGPWDSDEGRPLRLLLGKAYVHGVDISWDSLYRGRKVSKSSLPTYPFKANRCWISW
jgi:acyl transferase domain-containing protein